MYHVTGTYERAVTFLDKLIKETCSSSSSTYMQYQPLLQKELVEEESSEDGYSSEGQAKRKAPEEEPQSSTSRELKY
jgi:hypothetical protein